MNSLNRIVSTFNYQKVDRIPRYEIFLPKFVSKFYHQRDLPREEILIYDYYDKIDIGAILADQNGPFLSSKKVVKRIGNEYYERDSWGRLLLKKDSAYFQKEIEVVIDEKKKIDSITFSAPDLCERHKGFKNYTQEVKTRFAPVSGVLGLYMGCSRLRGQQQFLVDMAEDLEFCKQLVDRLLQFTKEVALDLINITDTKNTALWINDEIAAGRGPLFSPKIFEKLFLPAYKELIRHLKSEGLKNVILHCDGNSIPLLDMIIEAGFTGLEGLAPTADMWLPNIKRKYGKKLILIGGMCNIETLAKGTFKDIRKEAEAIAEAAKDGGVIIGTHSIDVDIPVKNYDYYYSVMNILDRR